MKNTVTSVFNMLGGVAGLLAIALLIWRGGAIEKQINIDTGRIDTLEAVGSAGLRVHVQADDERVSDLRRRASDTEARMLTMENNIKQYGELKVEIRVIGTKLDGIADRLKSFEETAAERLARLNSRPAKEQ